jgi:hypothetical protein
MRFFIRLVVFAALLAIVAFLTRPGEEKAESMLRTEILSAVVGADIDTAASGADAIVLGLCKLKPNECYELLRSGIETRFDDRALFTRFEFRGLGKRAGCIGAFTTFFCPGGLRDDT